MECVVVSRLNYLFYLFYSDRGYTFGVGLVFFLSLNFKSTNSENRYTILFLNLYFAKINLTNVHFFLFQLIRFFILFLCPFIIQKYSRHSAVCECGHCWSAHELIKLIGVQRVLIYFDSLGYLNCLFQCLGHWQFLPFYAYDLCCSGNRAARFFVVRIKKYIHINFLLLLTHFPTHICWLALTHTHNNTVNNSAIPKIKTKRKGKINAFSPCWVECSWLCLIQWDAQLFIFNLIIFVEPFQSSPS